MANTRICPTCLARAKYREEDGVAVCTALQDEQALHKIVQLKKAFDKAKALRPTRSGTCARHSRLARGWRQGVAPALRVGLDAALQPR